MKVSVIINCHNGKEFLKTTLDSVLKQSYKNFEIIFFDNASNDGTAELVAQYKDSRIRYFKSNVFLTLGQARNEALSLSNGDFLAFLDADDIWKSTKLEMQVPLFKKNVGLVYTSAEIIYSGKVIKTVSHDAPQGNVFQKLLADYFLVMSSVMISRQALDSVSHWFDPRFEIIEEYDLFLRIAVNWEFRKAQDRLTQWRWHESSTTMLKSKLISKEKRIFLGKLKLENPDLYKNNTLQINKIKGKIMITLALNLYREGKATKARILLRKSSVITLKGLFVYLASFFPPMVIDKVYRLLKGNPLI